MSDDDTTYDEKVEQATEHIRTEPVPGSIAMDVVTRQLLFVRSKKADTLEEYYESEGFDLLTYKTNVYLPGVTRDNSAWECYYINDLSLQKIHEVGKQRDYDFPSGRLAIVPIENAWTDGSVGNL